MKPFFGTVVLGLIGVACLIYWADTGHRWHRLQNLPDHEIAKGEVWPWPGANIDEIAVKTAMLKYVRRPDIIFLGSSRVTYVDSAMFSPRIRFLNLGVNSASVAEYWTLWEAVKKFDKVPGRLVIYIDPWDYNRDWMEDSPRLHTSFLAKFIDHVHEWRELVSMTEFYASVKYFLFGEKHVYGYRWDGAQYGVDDMGPPPSLPELHAKVVDQYGTRIMPKSMQQWSFNPEAVRSTQALIQDMVDHHVSVMVVLPPFQPLALDLMRRNRQAAQGLEAYRSALEALRNPLPFLVVCNVLDPSVVHCAEGEFLDGAHMHRSCSLKVVQYCFSSAPSWKNLIKD